MNKKRWLQIVKWLWLVLVFGGAAYYFSKHYTPLLGLLRNLSPLSLVLSILFLVVGKYYLTYLSLWSIEGQDWKPTFAQMFYINAVTQLAKYLPGGIWHFVGRFGLYRNKGMTNVQSGRTMLVENLWLVLSAFCFGVIAIFAGGNSLIRSWLPSIPTPLLKFGVPLLCLLLWILGLHLIERLVSLNHQNSPVKRARLLIVQAIIWVFIGLSFWVLLPDRWNGELFSVSMGSFALSWVAGYLTVFAPSGLGVREAAIAALLSAYLPSFEAAVYATVARLVWIVTEVGLGFFSEFFFGSNKLSGLFSHASLPTEESAKTDQSDRIGQSDRLDT